MYYWSPACLILIYKFLRLIKKKKRALSLSLLWFSQGSMFRLPVYLCIYVLLVSSLFFIYKFLHLIKKKEERALS